MLTLPKHLIICVDLMVIIDEDDRKLEPMKCANNFNDSNYSPFANILFIYSHA